MNLADFDEVELVKFDLLATGVSVTAQARELIAEHVGERGLSSADYASTSGVILDLGSGVWVNAPTADFNSNFVNAPSYLLDRIDDGFQLRGPRSSFTVRVWVQPQYHRQHLPSGVPYNSYAYTHGDRVRVSPVEGCAYRCEFCDLPFEFRYRTKDVDELVASVRAALRDPAQPAAHVLVSGGTPVPRDYGYLRAVYERVIRALDGVRVDVMMVPLDDVMEPAWLAGIGVAEVSINLELWSLDAARTHMRQKYAQGRNHYLESLEAAAAEFGGDRVRSMLLVGLENLTDTLAGVEAIAALGCTPVLSPFRPDPSTPLHDAVPPSADLLREAYASAREITQSYGVALGPTCRPCAHNTLTLPDTFGNGDAVLSHGEPNAI